MQHGLHSILFHYNIHIIEEHQSERFFSQLLYFQLFFYDRIKICIILNKNISHFLNHWTIHTIEWLLSVFLNPKNSFTSVGILCVSNHAHFPLAGMCYCLRSRYSCEASWIIIYCISLTVCMLSNRNRDFCWLQGDNYSRFFNFFVLMGKI